ncbi:hypothetical protein BgiBS90_016769 [Biomphalaria glabrata]|nr:hypothetical protein BgiBS90_016769 [Biomphalaria glabrata]
MCMCSELRFSSSARNDFYGTRLGTRSTLRALSFVKIIRAERDRRTDRQTKTDREKETEREKDDKPLNAPRVSDQPVMAS